ncbi:MAG: PepSY domain-containing protein [Candidatus Omnitrophota bacterium]
MISKEEAIEIARKKHGTGFQFSSITHGVPANFSIYGSFPQNPDDVWRIQGGSSQQPVRLGLFSSHAIVISKESGEILYDGGAGDEE